MGRVRHVPVTVGAHAEDYDGPEEYYQPAYPAAIGWLKTLGGVWLGISVIFTALLVTGLCATVQQINEAYSVFGTSFEIPATALLYRVVAALAVLGQGALVWAVLNVLAIIAETLIDIRDK